MVRIYNRPDIRPWFWAGYCLSGKSRILNLMFAWVPEGLWRKMRIWICPSRLFLLIRIRTILKYARVQKIRIWPDSDLQHKKIVRFQAITVSVRDCIYLDSRWSLNERYTLKLSSHLKHWDNKPESEKRSAQRYQLLLWTHIEINY